MSNIEQLADELHKPKKKITEYRKVLSNHINQYFSIDLVEMQEYENDNMGYKYILFAVDVYSRYAFAEPLKSKSGAEVASALQKIINKASSPPDKLWSDLGKEFYNKNVDSLRNKYNIGIYSTFGKAHSSIVERFNKTIKNIMFKKFTVNGNRIWYNMLDNLVKQYNNKKNTAINTSPNNAYHNKIELKMNETDDRTETKPKYKVGDKVRVAYNKEVFQKGYHPNWSHQLYIVSEVQKTKPTTYKIKDERGEEIVGSFYDAELQKSNQSEGVYLVEKILKTRTKNGKKENFVKFQGYDDSWNEWIPESNVVHNLKDINKLKKK